MPPRTIRRIVPTNGTYGNGSPGVRLHKDHAIVHTASIDVKIIRLNKRQLTLSVFRQLDEEFIITPDGTLKGVPWGRVNYTWKDNSDCTAFHVIWQDGTYLKRSPVPSLDELDNWYSKVAEEAREPLMEVRWTIQGLSFTLGGFSNLMKTTNYMFIDASSSEGASVEVLKTVPGLITNSESHDYLFELRRENFPQATQILTERLAAFQRKERSLQAVDKDNRARFESAVVSLYELDQLFIAT